MEDVQVGTGLPPPHDEIDELFKGAFLVGTGEGPITVVFKLAFLV